MIELLYTSGNLAYEVELTGEWDDNNNVINGTLTFKHVDGEITTEKIDGTISEIDAYVQNKINL